MDEIIRRDGEMARAHLSRNNDKTNDAEDAFKFRFRISYTRSIRNIGLSL